MNNQKYKQKQIEYTKQYEKETLSKYGTKISMKDFESLLDTLGLFVDHKDKNMEFHNYNDMKYLYWSTLVKCKESKQAWCNTNSTWYKQNVNNKTELYHRFKEIRNNYYSVYRNAIFEI